MDDLTFWSRVNIREPWECWPWMRNHTPAGYGNYSEREPGADRPTTHIAHREAYVRAGAFIREGEQIHHECGVRDCCNPRHLFAMNPQQHRDRHDLVKWLKRYPIEDRIAHLESLDQETRDLLDRYELKPSTWLLNRVKSDWSEGCSDSD